MRTRLEGGLSRAALVVSILTAAIAAACGTTTAERPTTERPAKPKSTFDPCANDKPPPKTYTGPLRAARCEQEMFLTMAGIADDLGVKCDFCHVPKPDNPKSFEFEKMTPNKEVALWMSHTFMTGLKRADGKPMDCGDCHVNKAGKPAAKFLGEPRDIAWTVEWMTTVMTNRFQLADGSKLKCKHCHVGTWGTPSFVPKVIGKTDQVPHGPIPEAAPPAAPAATSAPPSDPPAADSSAPAPSSSATVVP